MNKLNLLYSYTQQHHSLYKWGGTFLLTIGIIILSYPSEWMSSFLIIIIGIVILWRSSTFVLRIYDNGIEFLATPTIIWSLPISKTQFISYDQIKHIEKISKDNTIIIMKKDRKIFLIVIERHNIFSNSNQFDEAFNKLLLIHKLKTQSK